MPGSPAIPTVAPGAGRGPRSAAGVVGAGAVVGAASVGVNGLAYLVPLLATRLLPDTELGALSALLAVGAVAAVVGIGLQTALAVRWARHDVVARADQISFVTTAVGTGALLVGAPVLALALHLPVTQPVVLAIYTCPVVLAGRWLGELQGRQRYGLLAVGMGLLGLGRYGGVLAALAAGLGVTGSLAAGAVAAGAAVAVIAWLARHARTASSADDGTAAAVGGREVLRAASATSAMLAISYVDLILARALLSAPDAGAYAVGAVLTKGALWAPAMLTILALPMFAQARRGAVGITLAATGVCGVGLVGASAIAGDLAIRLAGPAQYAHLAPWAAGFAAVGALYAVVFVLVNARIAAMVRRPALVVWLALAAIVAAAAILQPSTVGGMLTIAVVGAAATTVVMTATYALRRPPAPAI